MQNILFFLKKYIKDIILFILIIICLGLIIWKCFLDNNDIENNIDTVALVDEKENVVSEKEEEVKNFNVDIKGAIKKPGVYQVKEGSIINDIVTLAGGFNTRAYKDGINLSKKVSDEMVIYVYTNSEIKEIKKEKDNQNSVDTNKVCEEKSYNINNCIDEGYSVVEVPNGDVNKTQNNNEHIEQNSSSNDLNNKVDQTEEESKLVNINTADIAGLTSLSGIGEAKAKAIIEYRSLNGNFKTIEDIMKVSGIGEAAFGKIKDFITV